MNRTTVSGFILPVLHSLVQQYCSSIIYSTRYRSGTTVSGFLLPVLHSMVQRYCSSIIYSTRYRSGTTVSGFILPVPHSMVQRYCCLSIIHTTQYMIGIELQYQDSYFLYCTAWYSGTTVVSYTVHVRNGTTVSGFLLPVLHSMVQVQRYSIIYSTC